MYSIFVNNTDKALLGQWPEAILIFKSPRQGGATASKQAILHVTVREACVSRDRETQMKMPFAYRFIRFYMLGHHCGSENIKD